MTVIIAARFNNAGYFRRWLPAGRADACPKEGVEPFVGPRSSPFATTLELTGTLTEPACRPDRGCGSYRRASRTPSAPAKST
jgi:hypothetical protein